jgi:hypothetical protein
MNAQNTYLLYNIYVKVIYFDNISCNKYVLLVYVTRRVIQHHTIDLPPTLLACRLGLPGSRQIMRKSNAPF